MGDRDLVTARLVLRPVSAGDVDALHELWTHPDVRRFLWDDAILPREDTAAVVARSAASFADGGHGLWLARRAPAAEGAGNAAPALRGAGAAPSTPALIGFCGYWPFHDPPELELLYGLGRDAWGRGYATEMATAVLAYGFERLGFDRVQASTDAPNTASIRVMERLGMTFHRRTGAEGRETIFHRLRREDFTGSRDRRPR